MADCPHGEVHPSACLECVDGVPAPVQKWSARRAVVAEWPAYCARDDGHTIQPGQLIYEVPGEGWCCGWCAQVAQEWHGTGYVQDDVRVVTAAGITQLWCKTCGAVLEKPAEQIDVRAEIQGHHARGCPF